MKLVDQIQQSELEPWEDVLERIVEKVHRDFYSPLLEKRVELIKEKKKTPGGREISTAYFDFKTDIASIFESFLDEVHEYGDITQDQLVDGIMKHEWGHYVVYPKDVATLMYLRQFGHSHWKEQMEPILAYWVDLMDNLPQILKEKRGQSIRDLYKAMNIVGENKPFSPVLDEMIESVGVDPETVREIDRKYSVDRFMTWYYQIQSKEDLGIDLDYDYVKRKQKHRDDKKDNPGIPDWTADEEKYLEEKMVEMLSIDFSKREYDEPNYVLFGSIIKDIMDKRDEEMPDELDQLKQQGPGGCTGGEGEEGEGGEGEGEEGEGNPFEKLGKPMMGDAPNFGDFTDEQLDEALDDIIKKFGKGRYERIKEYVEKETGKSFDKAEPKKGKRGIGLEKSSLQFHDEQIPYYTRKAATYGAFIHKRPLEADAVNSHREGYEEFDVGKPVSRFNPFATGGKILPGISKAHKLVTGSKLDKQYRVPHLFIYIDSSGSMEHPKSFSKGVLAGYVCARNYHMNGAYVGVGNFSCDSAFLLPTRDLDQIYSMVTAYWGGGTAPDIEKIKKYMKMLERYKFDERSAREGDMFTSEQDNMERFLESLPEDERRKLIKKDLEVDLSGCVKDVYEKVDNVIITDGGIYNMDEFIGYINQTGKVTRNTIFLMHNPYLYKEWSNMTLENTQVIHVGKEDDLAGLVIGGPVRRMAGAGQN
jgi:hypothetical protein